MTLMIASIVLLVTRIQGVRISWLGQIAGSSMAKERKKERKEENDANKGFAEGARIAHKGGFPGFTEDAGSGGVTW